MSTSSPRRSSQRKRFASLRVAGDEHAASPGSSWWRDRGLAGRRTSSPRAPARRACTGTGTRPSSQPCCAQKPCTEPGGSRTRCRARTARCRRSGSGGWPAGSRSGSASSRSRPWFCLTMFPAASSHHFGDDGVAGRHSRLAEAPARRRDPVAGEEREERHVRRPSGPGSSRGGRAASTLLTYDSGTTWNAVSRLPWAEPGHGQRDVEDGDRDGHRRRPVRRRSRARSRGRCRAWRRLGTSDLEVERLVRALDRGARRRPRAGARRGRRGRRC